MLLLCSDLAMTNFTVKPYTLHQWEILSKKLLQSELQRPKSFLETSPNDWKKELQMSYDDIDRISKLLSRSGQLAIEIDRLNSMGIWITTRAENTYPQRYKKLLRTKSPVILYGAGDLDLLNNKAVAIVGSRDVDEKGIEFTEAVSKSAVRSGYAVVSGGARGVDSAAEKAALQTNGKVISVLADSLESTLRKKEIRDQILRSNLLLLSAYNPKAKFRGYTSMERNKHIYALADYSFVSASSTKGGTWSGASDNLNYAWSPLLVRKASDAPDGNAALIELGGIPILDDEIDKACNDLKAFVNFKRDKKSIPNNNSAKTYSLFETVWPLMEKYLKEERTVHDVSNFFLLHPEQARLWLEEAVKNNRVIRTTKGYKKAPPVTDSLQMTFFEV